MSVSPSSANSSPSDKTASEINERWTAGVIVSAVILRRELIRFVRQPARVVAAIGTPSLLWLFMASGFAEALRPERLGDVSYAGYLLPGMMTLVAVFAAIFSSISIIEDRHEGWLQAVLVSPAPRWAVALGKVAGGSVVAWAQAALLLAAAPLIDIHLTVGTTLEVLVALAVTSFAMTAVGVAFAWRIETTGGFHAFMNLLFMPLWLLSGSIFPVHGAAAWLGGLISINPLTWCTHSIRGPMLGEASGRYLAAAAVLAAVAMASATWILAAPSKATT